MAKKSILFFLPEKDFNDEEFLIPKRVFENSGVKVFVASDAIGLCVGQFGYKIKPDVKLFNVHPNNFEGLVLVGGKGAKTYWDNQLLHEAARKFFGSNKIVAAICSAPVILARAGLLRNQPATCYHENKNELLKEGCDYKEFPVVTKKKLITAEGPKASLEFAQNILSLI